MSRACLVRLSAMGDVVQSLGAVQSLLAARPDLQLHFVTQTAYVPLVQDLGFASIIAHDRSSPLGMLRTRAAMRAVAPQWAIDLQGNWKSALVTRLSGAAVRIGVEAKHRQEPTSAMLINDRVAVDGPGHPATIALQLLRRIEPGLTDRHPTLRATAAEIEVTEATLRELEIDAKRPFTVMVVGDPTDNRTWPVDAMRRQADRESGPVLWLRGPDEMDAPVPAGAVTWTHGPGQLRQLVALGCVVRRSGGTVLGPDQGATHVLVACGAAVQVFFGPSDPRRTAPRAAGVLRKSDAPPCEPCRRRRCDHRLGPICMDFTSDESQVDPIENRGTLG